VCRGRSSGVLDNVRIKTSGLVDFPPFNKTNWWDTTELSKYSPFWPWLRDVTLSHPWSSRECIVGIPSTPGKDGYERMAGYFKNASATISSEDSRALQYEGNQTPVDAAPESRMPEMLMNDKGMCVFDPKLQDVKMFHLTADSRIADKLLIHFYAFLFFEDWRHDLWTKRFVRDHLRYRDEILCAAARVVGALRQKARENGNPNGEFDSFHVRRGDFVDQYEMSIMDAHKIINTTADVLEDNSTIFIATHR
jgi:hypothetical protein